MPFGKANTTRVIMNRFLFFFDVQLHLFNLLSLYANFLNTPLPSEPRQTAKQALTLRSPPTPGAPARVWKCSSRCWRYEAETAITHSFPKRAYERRHRPEPSAAVRVTLKGEKYPLGRAGEGDRVPLGVWGAGGQQPEQGSQTSSGVPRR